MGFYGKVNNNSAAQFVIDKIYSSRVEMEQALKDGDNIFIGRYVLIEYNHALTQLFKTTIDKEIRFYFSRLLNEDSRAKFLSNDKELMKEEYYKKNYIKENQIIYILDENSQTEYYKCIGGDDNGYAIFEKQAENYSPAEENIYFDNYLKDTLAYPDSRRGYDSTVWQKIYVDESEDYVMIAELNSVVPTFDLTIDAPTEAPAAPHFDTDSTNVYYRLHVQPNWGFRIKPNSPQSDANGKAIYFNDAGFKKETRSFVNIKDNITMTKAQSGAVYNTHNPNNPNEKARADDIQELSIILPSIGNTISDVWDIVFGKVRQQDINWGNKNGLRLIKENENGYQFNEKEVATLAGCINSIHDLMGDTIIWDRPDDPPELNDVLSHQIYYGKIKSEDKDEDKGYRFYIKDYKYEYETSKEPPKPTLIENMKEFKIGSYHYKTSDNNYYLAKEKYNSLNKYYDLTKKTKEIQLIDAYIPNKYYYLDNNNYMLEKNKLPDDKIYYEIFDNKMQNITDPNAAIPVLFFNPKEHIAEDGINKGYFYLYEGQYRPVKPDSELNENYQYFWVEGYTIEKRPSQEDPNDPNKDQDIWIVEQSDIKYEVKFIEFDETKEYFSLNDELNYIRLFKNNIDENIVYKVFVEGSKVKIEHPFYKPELYYYMKNNDNNYIFGIEENMVPNVIYYELEEVEALEAIFYEPNKYWCINNDGFLILDSSKEYDENKKYYTYTPLYIEEDPTGTFTPGALWNSAVSVENIPLGAKLATRKEVPVWRELEGFARTLNTVHGLIVQINRKLATDIEGIRDRQTVQGCINTLNDLIDKINALIPGEIMIVDEYGRIISAPFDTDDWINLKVNDDSIDHKITITHDYPKKAVDSISESDVNGKGDTITLETLERDDKGHVTKVNQNTVTLPFGYKFFQDVNETIGKTEATSTQDTITLSGDSWINPTVAQGKFTYAHIGPVVSNEVKKNDLTPDFGSTFEIEDWYFDEKGHKSNRTVHTVKIPQGDLTDNKKTGSDIITQLSFDKPTGALSTTRENLSSIKLAGYVKNEEDKADIVAEDTLGQALSKLQVQIIEEETARAAIIDALDMSDESDTHFISKITQTDGKVTVERAAAGTLVLGPGYAVASEDAEVSATDSINSAVGKLEYKLNILNAGSTQAGSVAYQIAQIVIPDGGAVDKLEEIAAWIVSDTTGAAKMNSDIKANADAIADLEKLVGNTAVAAQISDAIAAALTVDGTDKYALASELKALADRVKNLEGLIDSDKVAKWETQADWNESIETSPAFINNKPNLDNVVRTTTEFTYSYNDTTTQMTIEGLLAHIASLEARIAALEPQPEPEPSEPEPNPEDNT